MSTLPCKIYVANNTNAHALKYGLTIIGTYVACSFAFTGDIKFPILSGIGCILLGALLIYIYYRYDRGRKRSIEITMDCIRDKTKGVETQIDWDEMHQLYIKITGVQYQNTVTITKLIQTQVVAKGRNIMTDYQFHDFHQQIAELSYWKLLPVIKLELERGNNVSFGSIELNQDCLITKKKTYPLDTIREVELLENEFLLRIEGKRFPIKMDAREIANFSCLVTIIRDRQKLIWEST